MTPRPPAISGTNTPDTRGPVNLVVCGVGGSGTRVVVQMLQAMAPREQLADRNEADDTLAATLLFKHRGVLDAAGRFGFDTCWRDLQLVLDREGNPDNLPLARRWFQLALTTRPVNARRWYVRRAWRLRRELSRRNDGQPASWLIKEPNLQMVAGPILASRDDVDVIVIARNGLDMAFSRNQSQVRTWRDEGSSPAASLAHWCDSHDRLFRVAAQFPGRLHLLSFDLLCRDAEAGTRPLVHVLPDLDHDSIRTVASERFRPPASIGRHRHEDCSSIPGELLSRANDLVDRIESNDSSS
ncbi:MAG: sulfotransferase [Phycisphaerales bacterium]|nr:sulfotransferase [Phycisphaerales bacterium]